MHPPPAVTRQRRLPLRCLCLAVLLTLGLLLSGCADHDDDDESTASGIAGEAQSKSTSSTSSSSPPSSTSSSKSSSYPPVQGSGILWKPVSESDRKLVVLLPRSMGAPKVNVLDTSGNPIDNGRYVGRTNPDRATYRFGRPGRDYPAPCLLRVGTRIYSVPDGSRRYQ
jgi:hypothetical protein